MADSTPQLDTISSVITAEADFLNAVGNYQMNQEKILALEVAAEGDLTRIAEQREVLHQLRLTYHRLRQYEHAARDKQITIQINVNRVKWLFQGETLLAPLVTQVWMGFKTLLPLLLDYPSIGIIDRELSEQVHYGYGYSYNTHPAEHVPDMPKEVTNVHGLIIWCSKHHLMPKAGSPAMILLRELLIAIASAAEAKQAGIEKLLQELKDKTYTTWNPLEISKLPTDTAAKAAISGGSSS